MIKVTRLNGEEIILNAELIETVDAHPDTVIILSTGNKIVVREPVQEVIDKIMEYRKEINQNRKGKIPGG